MSGDAEMLAWWQSFPAFVASKISGLTMGGFHGITVGILGRKEGLGTLSVFFISSDLWECLHVYDIENDHGSSVL